MLGPRLSLIVMDPFQELACWLTQKNEEAPGRCCARGQLLQDGRRQSRGETDLLVRRRYGGLG